MSSHKRSIRAVDGDYDDSESSLLHRIRNMWQFANLCQWIYTFGKAAKISDSIDIEEIEAECLKPTSSLLGDIALALLKLVSSHRGLTHEIFDEQARKQYATKLPGDNPFGNGEVPAKFSDFDVFTKRIEPYGWDADDRTYYVLDDNRVYRSTEPPPSAPTPKPKKSKSWRGGRRASKRRRTTLSAEDDTAEADDGVNGEQPEDDGLGGITWECLAVSLADVRSLVDGFRKTRDENEKILRTQLEDHLVPILEKQEEGRKRKELQRERELANLAKMANAKRSSRIAGKIEQQKQDEHAKDEERHRREAEAAKRREDQANLKKERERDSRLISREKRLQEREARRLQHEDDLAHLSEDTKSSDGRMSERRLRVEIEKNKQALKDIEQEEEDWVFDCVCGLYGQVDDGTHSVACEKCNIWQHSKCLGITEEAAESPEFQFVCEACIRREQEAKARPRTTIKLKITNPHTPSKQAQHAPDTTNTTTPKATKPVSNHAVVPDELNGQKLNGVLGHGSTAVVYDPVNGSISNGISRSPNSALGAEGPALGKVSIGGSPRATPVIPAPIKLDVGEPERESRMSNAYQPGAGAVSPTASVRTASPSNSFHSLPGGRSFESALTTPKISRDIYRAAYVQNGTLPAPAGISPTKHSPPRPTDPGSATKISISTPILPPVASLSPSPRPQVLTPPSKPSELHRPLGSPSAKP
ncbi:hypothetical protein AK830_g1685 [Neonectria ditissima]|uniref:Zinc finger PHD-type domain-containing protein n=1 Tax=Neonectria ditissima TaxID=78410 RepID=A0A0P7BM08_9HYPO|nr:hypothetical protein AK830_g1685 [Neonectria ditissima]